MATACPDKNCIALARYPTSEPLPHAVEPNPSSKAKQARRAGAASAVAVPDPTFVEQFHVVAAPALSAEGLPYNRIALVLDLKTDGRAIQAYRAQLANTLKTLDAAVERKEATVELTLKVPEDLTKPVKGDTLSATVEPKKGKGKTKDKDGDGGKKKVTPKKKKAAPKKK